RKIKPRRDERGAILFEDRTDPREPRNWTRAEMIHVRGLALNGSLEGVSPVRSLRITLANSLARQSWERAFLRNDARPGV
ncbi:hypothetical protein C1X10_27635, partial [Escherichia coli]|uniref:hypothetical protein n=1 Tax=Escherichia coli TaxID=562 RepID=UPI000CB8A70C